MEIARRVGLVSVKHMQLLGIVDWMNSRKITAMEWRVGACRNRRAGRSLINLATQTECAK
jgi:hypothetical protein